MLRKNASGKKLFHLFFLQRNCIEFALNAKPVRRYIPKNPVQYKLWAFVTSPVFEYTIFAMILINTLSLAMKFYQQPELYTQFLDVLNVVFTVFFTLEFVFKLGAFRFKVCIPGDPFESVKFEIIGAFFNQKGAKIIGNFKLSKC